MKTVLILANHYITIYAFRRELVERLLKTGYKVIIALPYNKEVTYFTDMGCEIIETPLERRKTNPFSDLKLLVQYIKIMKRNKPDIVLTYTIKPNIYGGLASRMSGTKIIHTVTGLGSVYIQNIWQKRIIVLLNKLAFKKAEAIFFLNDDNLEFYKKMYIIKSNQNTTIVPGSGVNLELFEYKKATEDKNVIFTFVGRILKDKGIEEFLSAAIKIKDKYNNIQFNIVGFVDEKKYIRMLENYEKKGIIQYLGRRNDIPEIMEKSSCIVLPSYGEGRGTVLQEGAAIGRPLITCDTYGCKENVEEGVNGFLCKVADSNSLEKAMIRFIDLSYDEKILMGKESRKMAEENFDREIIIQKYINVINSI